MIQLRYYNMYHWWKCVLNARVYVHVMVVRWRLCAIDMRCHCLHLNQWHSQLLGQAPHTLNCEKYEYSSNPMKMNRSKRNQKSQKKIVSSTFLRFLPFYLWFVSNFEVHRNRFYECMTVQKCLFNTIFVLHAFYIFISFSSIQFFLRNKTIIL